VAIHLEGRARLVGDDVNTEYIIGSSRKRESLDATVLRDYLLEAVDPTFARSVRPGDLLVAGRNFGCGSAMEVAATVILAAGIPAVLAASFARTFYRNAVNNALVPVQCDTSAIREGDQLSVDLDARGATVRNTTTGRVTPAIALPPIMLDILQAGGVVPYLKQYGRFRV
jgi:3-isopropylmalate/(R)-2-methylmalate dehydratase small subunit